MYRADIPKPPAHFASLRPCVEIKYEFSAGAENSSAHVFNFDFFVVIYRRMNARKQNYLQGETVTFEVANAGYSSVCINVAGTDATMTAQMTLADGKWTETYDTKGLSGAFRFAIFADGKLIEEGAFSVRVLVSKYRETVAAIDEVIKEIAISGTASATLSAGGGSQSYTRANLGDLQKMRASFLNLAVAEENGISADDCATPRREDLFL